MAITLEDFSAVRSIPPKTIGNHGIFPTRKNPSGFVEYESQIERDFYLLLDHAPDIKNFQHQPIAIEYKDVNIKQHVYTPDVYVEFINGMRVIVEIKDVNTAKTNFNEFKEKWDAAERWCKEHGMLFSVLTDEDIRTERLFNVWFILGSSKCIINDKYLESLYKLLDNYGIKYSELCYRLAELLGVQVGRASQIICYAILEKVITSVF